MVFINILLASIFLAWWFQLIIASIIILTAYWFHKSRLKAIRHQKADLERQLLERSELLSYARLAEQKAKDEAETANRNKSQLLTKISHDIRTPMNTMMGMAALLNETQLTSEQQEYAQTIHYSGERLLSLINEILMNDILEYSKVESGRDLELKDFDLRNSVEEVLDVFVGKAATKGLDLVYKIEKGVPAQIVGDSLRLGQVLMNLIENSFRFTKKGEVFVGVKLIDAHDDDQIKLEFEVKDSGIGISSGKVKALLQELSPSNTSMNTNGAAGVGLVICKKLVGLMGGSITVESREGEGTSFKFTIVTRKSLQSSRPAMQVDRSGIDGKKILLVDDNATVCRIMKEQFEDWGLSVSIAHSGKQALETLAATPDFSLVITDMQMPGIDGVELAQSVKKINESLPIILLNKHGDESFRKNAALFNAVLSKPIHQQALSEQVLSVLKQKGSAGANVEQQQAKQKLSTEFAKQYPLRILVAEDDVMNQKVVTRVLNKLGYEPHISVNGKDVLEEVSHNTYDVILMDVQMPEMDGLEATRMIRVCLSSQPVIIAMTANTLQGDRDECLRAGMDDYTSKPVKLEELMNILEKWALKAKQKM